MPLGTTFLHGPNLSIVSPEFTSTPWPHGVDVKDGARPDHPDAPYQVGLVWCTTPFDR